MKDLGQFFKSIIDQDKAPVVICDLDNVVVYMNKAAAIHYASNGGYDIVGHSLLDCHNENSAALIHKVVEFFKEDKNNNIIHTFINRKEEKDVYMVALRDDEGELIGYYEKHEFRSFDNEPLYNI